MTHFSKVDVFKKKRHASFYLWTIIGVCFLLCFFAIKRRISSLDIHEYKKQVALINYNHYSRFTAFRSKSEEFYTFCLAHYILHKTLMKDRDKLQALSDIRKYRDFAPYGIVMVFDPDSIIAERLAVDTLFLWRKLHPLVDTILKIAPGMKFTDSIRRLKIPINYQNLNFVDLGKFENYIPKIDPEFREPSDVLEWIFADKYFSLKGEIRFVAPLDYLSKSLLKDMHYLSHDIFIGKTNLAIDSTGNLLEEFLRKRMFDSENDLVNSEDFINNDQTNVIPIYGIGIQQSLLLYFVCPLLTGAFLYERFYLRRFKIVTNLQPSLAYFQILNIRGAFRTMPFFKFYAFFFLLLESFIRLMGLFFIFYAIIFKFDFIYTGDKLMDEILGRNNTFQFFDLINLFCLMIVLNVFEDYEKFHPIFKLRIKNRLLLLIVFFLPILFLLVAIAHNAFIGKNEFITTYSLSHFIFLICLISFFYINAVKRNAAIFHYFIIILGVLFIASGYFFFPYRG